MDNKMPKIQIDGVAVMQSALASRLGLNDYEIIMKEYNRVNVSKDLDFQKCFNHFYRIRRNQGWRDNYYRFFESNKNKNITFEEILSAISCFNDNRVEAAFSSKMLATINPNMPIWDSKVLSYLGLELKGKTPEEKQSNAINIYYRIVDCYQKYLSTEEAIHNIEIFDLFLPKYQWLSSVKKIDCLLWVAE